MPRFERSEVKVGVCRAGGFFSVINQRVKVRGGRIFFSFTAIWLGWMGMDWNNYSVWIYFLIMRFSVHVPGSEIS